MRKKLLFDIGAHKGEFSDRYIDMGWSTVMFEPNEDLYCGLIDKYLHLYPDGDPASFYIILPYAVDDHAGIKTFYTCEADTVSTIDPDWVNDSRFKHMTWQESVKVRCVSIMDAVNVFGTPDYIKIDVEGNELNTILGITEYLCPIEFEWTVERQVETIAGMRHLKVLGWDRFRVECYPSKSNNLFTDFDRAIQDLLTGIKASPDDNPGWGMIHCKKSEGK